MPLGLEIACFILKMSAFVTARRLKCLLNARLLCHDVEKDAQSHLCTALTMAMRSMRSVRGGFIFRSPEDTSRPVSLRTSMTKHDAGGSPPGAACDSAKPPHDKMQGSASGLRGRLSPYLPNGHFPTRPNYYSRGEGASHGREPLRVFYAFYAFYAWWIHFPQSGGSSEPWVLAKICPKIEVVYPVTRGGK